MRALVFLLILSISWLAGSEKGYWTTMEVRAYSPTQRDSLADGKTRYGTNAYQEGAAADRRFYPEGTKLYLTWEENSQKRAKWFTVDDIHPKTVGMKGLIYIRFLTKKKVVAWDVTNCKIYVVLPIKKTEE